MIIYWYEKEHTPSPTCISHSFTFLVLHSLQTLSRCRSLVSENHPSQAYYRPSQLYWIQVLLQPSHAKPKRLQRSSLRDDRLDCQLSLEALHWPPRRLPQSSFMSQGIQDKKSHRRHGQDIEGKAIERVVEANNEENNKGYAHFRFTYWPLLYSWSSHELLIACLLQVQCYIKTISQRSCQQNPRQRVPRSQWQRFRSC